jgi:hypothetical protein
MKNGLLIDDMVDPNTSSNAVAESGDGSGSVEAIEVTLAKRPTGA